MRHETTRISLPIPAASHTTASATVATPWRISTALMSTAALGCVIASDTIVGLPVLAAPTRTHAVGLASFRADMILSQRGKDAVACFSELQARLAQCFNGLGEYVEIRFEERMPDEGDGPYVFVDVCTSRDVVESIAMLDAVKRDWWLKNRRRAPMVVPTLRFL